jgi:type I restriction enzyme S subunit
VGAINVANQAYGLGRGLCALRARTNVIAPDYLRYTLFASIPLLQAEATGSTYDAVALHDVGQLLVPFVSSPREQRAIADFLDRKTKKIDALVAKKERLIELLKEKRTALISRAVTKGLNSDAPMKDSGVEWLGSIPAHWNALPLRRGLLRIEQGWSPECENRLADDGEWGVLKAGCVNHGEFAPDEHKALPSGLMPQPRLEVRPGDLLMSRASGSTELVGSVACVTQCRARLMLSDKVFRLHADPRRANAEYLTLAMNSRAVRAQIESVLSGSVGLARNIGQSTIRELAVCFPPLDEQRTIVRDLEADAGPTRILVGKVVQAIERLREYRSALITSAVTGQIDVREYAKEAN